MVPDLRKSSAVPKAIFNTEVDAIASSYLKRPDLPTSVDQNRKYASALLSAAEALLISRRVTFKVYGENVVLAVLTRIFGVRGVEQLLEDDAIEFLLWRPLIAQPEEKLLSSGLDPLVYGNMSNAEHADPVTSCVKGLNWMPGIDRKMRRALGRKAAKHMSTTPDDAPKQSVEAVRAAYRDGSLLELGFDPNTPTHELSADDRSRLLKFATELTESAVLFEREWDLYEGEGTWGAMMRIATEVRSSGNVATVAEEILRTETLPSIWTLLLNNRLSFQDVLRLRRHAAVRDFQEWLWTRPDPTDAKEVLEAYKGIVAKDLKNDPLDNSWLRLFRLVGVTLLGGAIGSAIGGPLGAVGGAAAHAVGENAGAVGVSYLDTLIDTIRKGRSPRRFAALLRDQMIVTENAGLK